MKRHFHVDEETRDTMKIIDFIDKTDLQNRSECEKAKLLCFYHFKETGEKQFTMSGIASIMVDAGFNAPNNSRLRDKLIKGKDKAFLLVRGTTNMIEFIPAVYQRLNMEFAGLWEDNISIDSNSELLDETKFCGKRNYLDQLIYQINHTYANNCYDATAVLMRRLFEVMLVLTYQHFGIDDEIKDSSGKGYLMLDSIIKKAKDNKTIKLSRIKLEFDNFRMVGNFSAHNITYTAGKKDIDDIKINYRVMLEELYNKAGLL